MKDLGKWCLVVVAIALIASALVADQRHSQAVRAECYRVCAPHDVSRARADACTCDLNRLHREVAK